jgi:cardiolipin synthase A/B
MHWFFETWDDFMAWLPFLLGVFDFFASVLCVAWVLMTKPEASSAIAWILLIFFLPFVGFILFFLFGYQHVNRPLKRKRRHKLRYERPANPANYDSTARLPRPLDAHEGHLEGIGDSLARLAFRMGGYHVTEGNQVDFYFEGQPTFEAMIDAIKDAKHHVHMLFFIFQPDELGKEFLKLLAAKAKQGVEVRLIYDAMGSHRLHHRLLAPLRAAGGKVSVFLPINLLRRRLQINMRNHRKIVVVDGTIGFIGGLNIGDEYVGKNKYFGFWRDTHLRIRGPAVVDLQRVFAEDWSFASGENLYALAGRDAYFTAKNAGGPHAVQVIDSGPDRDLKTIREITFAAILKAQKRVWIASPYFVPDAGLLDALRLAAYQGLDVRFLGQYRPDKWIPQFAAKYYWADVLTAGVQVYQYTKGMMHAKVMLIDDEFASVGTANLDNRSMFLNFEVNCLLYSAEAVKRLEESFLCDFGNAVKLERSVYAKRPFVGRLLENACRLLSPIL